MDPNIAQQRRAGSCPAGHDPQTNRGSDILATPTTHTIALFYINRNWLKAETARENMQANPDSIASPPYAPATTYRRSNRQAPSLQEKG